MEDDKMKQTKEEEEKMKNDKTEGHTLVVNDMGEVDTRKTDTRTDMKVGLKASI